MNKANFISPSHVRELFTYSEGQLFWQAKRKGRKRSQAGYQSKAGYTQIRIDGKLFYLHRLVWAYHFDEVFSEIDHIDGNPANSRIENLRPATHQQNMFNSKRRTNNTSGFVGVSKSPWGWNARIRMNGRYAHLGVFDSPEAASNAYQTAAAEHHKEFIRSNL
jgi:hypothetical protein